MMRVIHTITKMILRKCEMCYKYIFQPVAKEPRNKKVVKMSILDSRIIQIVIACIIPYTGIIVMSMIFPEKDDTWTWYGQLKKPSYHPPNWVNYKLK
jgi:hypothetical protein